MMFGGDWSGGVFGISILWLLLSVGWIVLVALLIALVVRYVFFRGSYGDRYQPPGRRPEPLQILQERFARGEISREEYEEARRILGV